MIETICQSSANTLIYVHTPHSSILRWRLLVWYQTRSINSFFGRQYIWHVEAVHADTDIRASGLHRMLSWVELNWVVSQYTSSWMELSCVALRCVARHAFGFRHKHLGRTTGRLMRCAHRRLLANVHWTNSWLYDCSDNTHLERIRFSLRIAEWPIDVLRWHRHCPPAAAVAEENQIGMTQIDSTSTRMWMSTKAVDHWPLYYIVHIGHSRAALIKIIFQCKLSRY